MYLEPAWIIQNNLPNSRSLHTITKSFFLLKVIFTRSKDQGMDFLWGPLFNLLQKFKLSGKVELKQVGGCVHVNPQILGTQKP